jgi:hypothetical protein
VGPPRSVFGVAVLPLSLRLARRVEGAHQERERMTKHAVVLEFERRGSRRTCMTG